MENLSNTKTNDFQQLQIMHGALMMGAVLMCIVLGYLMTNEGAVANFDGWSHGLLLIATIVMGAEICPSLSVCSWKVLVL